MSKPRVAIDTGVVIKALLGADSGHSYMLMEAVGTAEILPVLSDSGMQELNKLVERLKWDIVDPARAFRIGADLWRHGILCHPQEIAWDAVTDAKDHWILDLAWASGADYIATVDNKHLIRATMPFPVEVLSPTLLLSKLGLI